MNARITVGGVEVEAIGWQGPYLEVVYRVGDAVAYGTVSASGDGDLVHAPDQAQYDRVAAAYDVLPDDRYWAAMRRLWRAARRRG